MPPPPPPPLLQYSISVDNGCNAAQMPLQNIEICDVTIHNIISLEKEIHVGLTSILKKNLLTELNNDSIFKRKKSQAGGLSRVILCPMDIILYSHPTTCDVFQLTTRIILSAWRKNYQWCYYGSIYNRVQSDSSQIHHLLYAIWHQHWRKHLTINRRDKWFEINTYWTWHLFLNEIKFTLIFFFSFMGTQRDYYHTVNLFQIYHVHVFVCITIFTGFPFPLNTNHMFWTYKNEHWGYEIPAYNEEYIWWTAIHFLDIFP